MRPPGPHSPKLAPHGPVALSPRYRQSSGTLSDAVTPTTMSSREGSHGFSRSFRARITNAVEKRCRSRRDDNCDHFWRTLQKYSHGQHFDPSVPRGNDGRGETRRRRPRFLQRCRNDNPLSVAANGSMKTRPMGDIERALSRGWCETRCLREHRVPTFASIGLVMARRSGREWKETVPLPIHNQARVRG